MRTAVNTITACCIRAN